MPATFVKTLSLLANLIAEQERIYHILLGGESSANSIEKGLCVAMNTHIERHIDELKEIRANVGSLSMAHSDEDHEELIKAIGK
jgi:L-2-hydroxyglutarate oxidase LhgO